MDSTEETQIDENSAVISTKSDKSAEIQKDKDSLTKREASNRAKRLEFLLKQTEKFSDFFQVKAENKKVRQSRFKGRGRRKSDKSQPKRAIVEDDEDSESDDEDSIDKVHEFKKSPPYINGEMRDYQIRGLNWLVKLYENGINGILADEMGLGKTLQTISLLGYLRHHKNVKGKHIVFCPKSTVFNWVKEFNRWCPEIRAIAYVGLKEEREEIERTKIKTKKFDVLVTNYEMMLHETSVLKKIVWHFLIVDEGHRLKNENSSFSKLTRQLKSSHRLVLTGTPLQNNLHELWALLNFLLPDIFSRSDDFDSWFDTTTVLSSGDTLVTRLHTILKPFFLRRIKSDVEKSLLPKIEYKLYVGITSLQRELYIKTLKKEFEYFNPSTCRSVQVHEASQILMNLRKICNHPYMLPGVEQEPFVTDEKLVQVCGKMQLLDKLLTMLKEQGSKVLIFAQFKILLSILEDYFDLRGYKYCRLDGETSFEERMEYMEDFNREDSDKFIFLLSTRAGGLGINLTAADTVIIYDSDWNPQVDIQAEDRAHRIGQMKQVKVFRLISEKTIDERIIQRAAIKLLLDQKVIQEGRLLDSAKMGKNEMKGMIYYDMEEIMKSTESTITDENIQEIMKRSQEKSKELEKQVKNSEINFENFDTIFKFDGTNYTKGKENTEQLPAGRELRSKKRKVHKNPKYKDGNQYQKRVPYLSIQGPSTSTPRYLQVPREHYSEFVSYQKPPMAFDNVLYAQKRFGWNEEEFQEYLEWIKENGKSPIEYQIVPTRTLDEIKIFHKIFWSKFVYIGDPELRLMSYNILYTNWEPTILKVHQACKGDLQNLSNIDCKFRTNCGYNKFAVAYIMKKLYNDGTKNHNLFQEMSKNLTKIGPLVSFYINGSELNKEIYSKSKPENMGYIITKILHYLETNIELYWNDPLALGKKSQIFKFYYEFLESSAGPSNSNSLGASDKPIVIDSSSEDDFEDEEEENGWVKMADDGVDYDGIRASVIAGSSSNDNTAIIIDSSESESDGETMYSDSTERSNKDMLANENPFNKRSRSSSDAERDTAETFKHKASFLLRKTLQKVANKASKDKTGIFSNEPIDLISSDSESEKEGKSEVNYYSDDESSIPGSSQSQDLNIVSGDLATELETLNSEIDSSKEKSENSNSEATPESTLTSTKTSNGNSTVEPANPLNLPENSNSEVLELMISEISSTMSLKETEDLTVKPEKSDSEAIQGLKLVTAETSSDFSNEPGTSSTNLSFETASHPKKSLNVPDTLKTDFPAVPESSESDSLLNLEKKSKESSTDLKIASVTSIMDLNHELEKQSMDLEDESVLETTSPSSKPEVSESNSNLNQQNSSTEIKTSKTVGIGLIPELKDSLSVQESSKADSNTSQTSPVESTSPKEYENSMETDSSTKPVDSRDKMETSETTPQPGSENFPDSSDTSKANDILESSKIFPVPENPLPENPSNNEVIHVIESSDSEFEEDENFDSELWEEKTEKIVSKKKDLMENKSKSASAKESIETSKVSSSSQQKDLAMQGSSTTNLNPAPGNLSDLSKSSKTNLGSEPKSSSDVVTSKITADSLLLKKSVAKVAKDKTTSKATILISSDSESGDEDLENSEKDSSLLINSMLEPNVILSESLEEEFAHKETAQTNSATESSLSNSTSVPISPEASEIVQTSMTIPQEKSKMSSTIESISEDTEKVDPDSVLSENSKSSPETSKVSSASEAFDIKIPERNEEELLPGSRNVQNSPEPLNLNAENDGSQSSNQISDQKSTLKRKMDENEDIPEAKKPKIPRTDEDSTPIEESSSTTSLKMASSNPSVVS